MPQMDLKGQAADIRAACIETGRELADEQALSLARLFIAYGGPEGAVMALAQDDACGLLGAALAYRAALTELSDPAILIARLLREALDLDARAVPAWEEAAEFHGKARYRARQGEGELARRFHARALSAERFAVWCEDQALAKRLQAAGCQAGAGLNAALLDLAA